MTNQRKKSWETKQLIVRDSYLRSNNECDFAHQFYNNLFFLRPALEDFFKNVDRTHQEKALLHGLDHLLNYKLHPKNEEERHHTQQIARLAQTHSKKNLNINPHVYYYWIDAFVMTLKKNDPKWEDEIAYYTRECLFLPISFMISLYHR